MMTTTLSHTAPLKGFSENNANILNNFLKTTSSISGRKIAIFDADGTLWKGDIGDAFLKYQLDRGQLTAAQGEKYLRAFQEGGHEAEIYGWLAQWNAGVAQADLFTWARDCFQGFQHSIFSAQKQLVATLQQNGFEVWVVSASIWWVVAVGVEQFGISSDHVLAAKVDVQQGILTDQLAYPVPYKAGKVAVINEFIKSKPLLVSGNSMGDFDMMALAESLVLAINSDSAEGLYYGTEQELKKRVLMNHAQNRGMPGRTTWLLQNF